MLGTVCGIESRVEDGDFTFSFLYFFALICKYFLAHVSSEKNVYLSEL